MLAFFVSNGENEIALVKIETDSLQSHLLLHTGSILLGGNRRDRAVRGDSGPHCMSIRQGIEQ
jgi:hypothetical protein